MIAQFNQNNVHIHSCEINYQGFMQIHTLSLQHALFSGGMSPVLQRELCHRKNAVAVLPYDPISDRLVLIQQFRVGAYKAACPWLFEIVAGIYDHENETATELAAREAQEEAGLQLLEVELIADYWVSPGACDEKMTLFYGKIDASDLHSGIYGNPDEQEDIKVYCLDYQQASELFRAGQFNNATTLIAWLWLQTNRERLRTQTLES